MRNTSSSSTRSGEQLADHNLRFVADVAIRTAWKVSNGDVQNRHARSTMAVEVPANALNLAQAIYDVHRPLADSLSRVTYDRVSRYFVSECSTFLAMPKRDQWEKVIECQECREHYGVYRWLYQNAAELLTSS